MLRFRYSVITARMLSAPRPASRELFIKMGNARPLMWRSAPAAACAVWHVPLEWSGLTRSLTNAICAMVVRAGRPASSPVLPMLSRPISIWRPAGPGRERQGLPPWEVEDDRVDAGLCLGCLSCSNVCPSQNITRVEASGKRTIHWKRCKEECDLCVEFCPAKALTLVAWDESVPEGEVSFDLVACKICGSRYATEPMLKRIESTLPAEAQKDASGLRMDPDLSGMQAQYRS